MFYGSVATYAKHPALAELAEHERRSIIRALAGQAFNGWRAFVAVFLGLAGLAIGLVSASQLQIPLGLPRSLEGPILVVAMGIPFCSVINAMGRSFVRARLRAYGAAARSVQRMSP